MERKSSVDSSAHDAPSRQNRKTRHCRKARRENSGEFSARALRGFLTSAPNAFNLIESMPIISSSIQLTRRRVTKYNSVMSMVTLELRPRKEQTAFNLRRWDEVLADPDLPKIEGRVETDRHGR